MGQAKQRGSRDQRVAEAIVREEVRQRDYLHQLASRQPSQKRAATKAMMTLAMMQAVVGGTRS